MAVNTVTDTVDALVTTLQTVAGLTNRVFPVVTDQELSDLARIVNFPALGVVYDGMTSRGREGSGLGSDFAVNLVIFYKAEGVLGRPASATYKQKSFELLDQIRALMAATPGPNGKRWTFVSEAPALQSGSLTMWVQRWTVPVVLT